MDGSVCERKRRAAQIEGRQYAVVGNPAESDNRPQVCHRSNRGDEIAPTGVDFSRSRFVFRREAADCVGHGGIDQRQAVIGRGSIGARCKAERRQCLVQEFSRVVPGERPTGPVGAA